MRVDLRWIEMRAADLLGGEQVMPTAVHEALKESLKLCAEVRRLHRGLADGLADGAVLMRRVIRDGPADQTLAEMDAWIAQAEALLMDKLIRVDPEAVARALGGEALPTPLRDKLREQLRLPKKENHERQQKSD
jgi:hypothetical protein